MLSLPGIYQEQGMDTGAVGLRLEPSRGFVSLARIDGDPRFQDGTFRLNVVALSPLDSEIRTAWHCGPFHLEGSAALLADEERLTEWWMCTGRGVAAEGPDSALHAVFYVRPQRRPPGAGTA